MVPLRLRDTRDALIVFIQRRVTGSTNYPAKDNLEEIIYIYNSLLWRNIKTVTHMEVAPGRLKLRASSSQQSSFSRVSYRIFCWGGGKLFRKNDIDIKHAFLGGSGGMPPQKSFD